MVFLVFNATCRVEFVGKLLKLRCNLGILLLELHRHLSGKVSKSAERPFAKSQSESELKGNDMDSKNETKGNMDLKQVSLAIGPTIGPRHRPGCTIGPTVGPTPTHVPTPTPTPAPTKSPAIGSEIGRFDPVDYPDRYVDELPSIGPEYARRLTKGGVGSLAALASAVATDVARILSISEVRAMSFIDKARHLLQGRSVNDQAGR